MNDNRNYTCGICGMHHITLDAYLDCVSKCGAKIKKEKKEAEEKEKLEKLNSALNAVKQAKAYYELKLNEFKKNYPEEYELNFGKEHVCKCKDAKSINKENSVDTNEPKVKTESVEFSYESDGKNPPKMSAKVNGKDVDKKQIGSIFEDPEASYIAQLLNLFNM